MAAEGYRYGNPRTEEERRRRHEELYGDAALPPRGSGRVQAGETGTVIICALGLVAYFAMLIASRKR